MPIIVLPKSIEERLGAEATKDLIEVLNGIERSAKEDILLIAEEKYGRRLSDEVAKIDKRISDEVAKIDKRISDEVAKINQRITDEVAKINQRITDEVAKINQRITDEIAKVNQKITEEVSKAKVTIIKWMVGLCIAQIGVTVAVVATIINALR